LYYELEIWRISKLNFGRIIGYLKYPGKAHGFLGLKKNLFNNHSSIILGYLFEPWVEIW